MADIVPPRTQESVITPRNLLSKHINALIIKRRESTKKRIEHASQRPHIHTLTVSFILHDLRGGIPYRPTGCHGLLVPHDFGQPEIGNLDSPDPTASNARYELAFVFLLLVVGSVRRVLGGHDRDPLKEEILGFDVAMDDTALFV